MYVCLYPYAQNHHVLTGITILVWDSRIVWWFLLTPCAYSHKKVTVDTYSHKSLMIDFV